MAIYIYTLNVSLVITRIDGTEVTETVNPLLRLHQFLVQADLAFIFSRKKIKKGKNYFITCLYLNTSLSVF